MLSFPQAVDVVERATSAALGSERIALADACGRIAAEDVVATEDCPAHDNSAMDGFALRAVDATGASDASAVSLRVAGEAPAGAPWSGTLVAGEAVRIFTGGLIPNGADSIVPIEQAGWRAGSAEVAILAAPTAGQHVRRAGADMKRGRVALRAGELLDAGALGVLATLGVARPLVNRLPRVALLMSGDELVEPGDALAPGQVRDVSGFTLPPLVGLYGGVVARNERVRDSAEAVRRALREAAESADVVVTVGGVSMGAERDLMRATWSELGLREEFWQVAQRPGKPLLFGRLGETGPFVFGLPGNPVSAWSCFHAYVGPTLRRLAGLTGALLPRLRVVCQDALPTPAPLTHLFRVSLEARDGRLAARLTGPQGSHVVSSLARNDALMVAPPELQALAPGLELEAIPIHPERCAIALARLAAWRHA